MCVFPFCSLCSVTKLLSNLGQGLLHTYNPSLIVICMIQYSHLSRSFMFSCLKLFGCDYPYYPNHPPPPPSPPGLFIHLDVSGVLLSVCCPHFHSWPSAEPTQYRYLCGIVSDASFSVVLIWCILLP